MGFAHAQSAGSLLASVGVTQLAPQVNSGSLSAPSAPGTKVDVSSDTQPTADITYMVTDDLALYVPLGLGFKHKLIGDGAIKGTGTIGTVRVLPVTVLGQYRFAGPRTPLRPYAMAGLTYAHFYDATGSAAFDSINPANPVGGHTTMKVGSKFALTVGLGMNYNIDDKWYVQAAYMKTFLKTRTTLSTGQTIDTQLDPNILNLAVGMRF